MLIHLNFKIWFKNVSIESILEYFIPAQKYIVQII